MNQTVALCKSLLAGDTVSIKNAYVDLGISNIAREIGRSIERKFGVKVTRTPRSGTGKYGQAVDWFDYKLERTKENQEGITKMVQYIIQEGGLERSGAKVGNEKIALSL